MSERIRRSTVAQAIVPALQTLADLRADLALGNHARALLHAEELAEILCAIEQDCGSVTPLALFGV